MVLLLAFIPLIVGITFLWLPHPNSHIPGHDSNRRPGFSGPIHGAEWPEQEIHIPRYIR